MHPMAERSGEFQSLDGRRVAFSRYGPDGGRPVLFHYGSPGTRHLGPRMVDAVERHGVRLLVLERPGYGASTRRPGRSIADVVADAAALVEMQGWERFSVWVGRAAGRMRSPAPACWPRGSSAAHRWSGPPLRTPMA